jgi:hypothetical protein
MHERRTVRSRQMTTALYLYLARRAQALGLDALAVASREGLLVSGTARDACDLETLAALAPVLAGDRASPSFIGCAMELASGASSEPKVDAASFDVEGEPFYLAWIGGIPPRVGEVQDTMVRLTGAGC